MRYFQLKSLGDIHKLKENVCLGKSPDGLGLNVTRLTKGKPLAKLYPENVEVHLKESNPGLLLTDVLSNTFWCFVGNQKVRQIVESVCGNENVEYLPFILFDQRGNRYSDEYCFIHPIKVIDVVDRASSQITYEDDDPNGEIMSVQKYAIAKDKLDQALPLFRVPEFTYDIFMNEILAKALYDAKISNVFLDEITQN